MKIALFCTNEFAIPLRNDIIFAPLPLFEELALGLAQKGHKIFLYAAANSKIKHHNIKLISGGLTSFDKAGFKNMWGSFHDQEVLTLYQQMLLNQLVIDEKKYKFDVIHIHHEMIHFLPFLNMVTAPVFFTLHDPLNDKREFLLKNCAWKNKAHFISISNNQRRDMSGLNYAATVYNGINLKGYKFYKQPKDYFVFLGRVSWEKGAHLAVQAANQTGVCLKIIGPRWLGNDYWNKEIKPYLNDKIEFLDKLPQKETRPIVGQARALLFPIQWEEPFGLVMIEALAGGAPVIAYKRGSVQEVIKDNKTGFIVNSVAEMTTAIKKIDKIDRKTCRRHVEDNFQVQQMVANYEKTYKKYVKK